MEKAKADHVVRFGKELRRHVDAGSWDSVIGTARLLRNILGELERLAEAREEER